jgi:hypothetical protein
MNSLRKILVVDNGDRGGVDPLAAQLAELGVSSVTASFEAADDVLGVIDPPSAILVKMPRARQGVAYEDFVAFTDRLRDREREAGIPVIVWDGLVAQAGGISDVLRSRIGPQALMGAEI